jgi:phage terminase large subunit
MSRTPAAATAERLQAQKDKADIEEQNDNKGYWYNWWRVYGLGLDGIVEGAIFHNWKTGEFDNTLPSAYGLDFGSRDPDALIKCAIDKSKHKIYLKEEIYTNGLSTAQLLAEIKSKDVKDKLIIADSQATRTITDLHIGGLNIRAVVKPPIVDSIKLIQDWELIIDPSSINLIRELTNYVWLDRKGEVPADIDNHAIDAARYIITTLLKFVVRKTTKLLR